MTLVTLLGVPWDASSTSTRGAAGGPAAIRQALWHPSSNPWNERGDDLSAATVLEDSGDVVVDSDAAATRAAIEARVREALTAGHKPLVLGGDHSITYPVVRAWSGRAEPISILHLDAHGDLYDAYDGERYSHASPFARIMEERLAGRLLQVGVRTLNAHQRAQASRFGVESLGAERWREAIPLIGRIKGPLYVSLDLDVLEPMLAPGLSHPEPGGLTVRDVLELLSAIRTPVVGADIVECNPALDVRDLTARVGAKFVKELVGVMRRSAGG
jgi:agmatinase